MASGYKGTWSLKVYAPNSSDNFDQSGKWWAGVYKEKRAKYTEEHREKDDDGNIIKDFEEADVHRDDWVYYAIDYFQSEANAQVTGTPWSGSEGDGNFRSQAEAKKSSNTAGITWKCDRSGTSDYHNGQKCRKCN
ncbi:hypothetical protein JT359_09160 [Candidatus Poribacteria bacterium]|nr:hypothetical protein [Candidatus Poribacteria bacterium]